MQKLVFKVKFLSDIVLPASSNTEGKIEPLDFIAGSNFLGMVAKEYDEFKDTSFDVFHSGKVRFGDATLLHEGKATYKMPLSFFHEKSNDTFLVNHHLISDFSQFTQLKQKRKGYITQELEEVSIKHNYAQKSAYDKERRRSKDSFMYGYKSIPAGTEWQFIVQYDDICDDDLKRIKDNLEGNKKLGKSKTSQYGQVEISLEKSVEEVEPKGSGTETVLYLKSRLALVDKEGNPTYDLKHLTKVPLSDDNIVYDKCQIRTSNYAKYDRSRKTKDSERVVINCGSVIVLKDVDGKLEEIKNGVGIYLSEGFGEVLVNPAFLSKNKFSFKAVTEKKDEDEEEIKDPLAKFLRQKEELKKKKLDFANEVQEFIDENKTTYPTKMNSQWGTIRSFCYNSSENEIEEKVETYISNGVAKDKWQGKKKTNLLEAISKSSNKLDFVKLLSMEMPKVINSSKKEDDKKDEN